MKLVLTNDFKTQLRVLAAQITIGLLTGSYNFGADAATVLRTLADEIDKQNPSH